MNSIFKKLLLIFIGLSLIPFAILAIYSYSSTKRLVEQRVGTSMQQSVEQMEISIDLMLESIENLSSTLLLEDTLYLRDNSIVGMLSEYEGYDYATYTIARKSLENIMSMYTITNRHIESVYLVKDERFIASAPAVFSTIVNPLSLDWYSDFLNSGKNSEWCGMHSTIPYSTYSNSNVISYMRKVNNRYNTINLGVMWIDVNERWFNEVYKKLDMQEGAEIFIVDASRNIVSHSQSTSLSENLPPESYTEALVPASGFYSAVIDGVSVIIAHSYLERAGWNIVYTIPLSAVMSDYYAMLKSYLFYTGIIFVLLALAILATSYTITFPLINLINLMKKASHGDFNVRAPVQSRDEIGELCSNFNVMIEDIDRLINEVYIAQTKQKEAELLALQFQINPHFLYNTLQTIKWLADSYNAVDIQNIVLSLARIFRFSIKSSSAVKLSDELQNIRDYITIQKFRYEQRLEVQIEVDKPAENFVLPNLVLQPLVENAIIHGIEKKPEGGKIRVNVSMSESEISIIVWDNGVGIDQCRLESIIENLEGDSDSGEDVSIGLRNIYERFKLMYGKRVRFSINSSPEEFTEVKITVAGE